MLFLLKYAVKMNIIRPIDFYFSQLIEKKNNILMLVAACVSYENSNGHVFLPIEYFKKNCFFSSSNKKFIKKIVLILSKKIDWSKELSKHPSISDGSIITPLILYKKKIYLYKMWKAEDSILNFLYQNKKENKINKKKCTKILENLFPEKRKNIQKIAVALTLINNITFIVGGPGTGKTTTILKIIIALIKNTKKPIKIQLSAPTGKAATHLTEVIKNDIFDVYLTKKEKNYLPSQAVTIHRLLKINKTSQKTFFNEKNSLKIDVLIIDETSMIDILTIEKIFFAVSQNTKLIFIGDHNQLCPIEAGFFLKNICYYSRNGYSLKMFNILKKITQYQFKNKINNKYSNFISNKICVLKKNHRFNNNSGIYTLSNAICNKKIEIIKNLFKNFIKNVFFYEIISIQQYKKMIEKIILNYKTFWEKIHNKKNIKEIIKTFQNYQVLCVLRDGLFGVNVLNEKLEENMHKKNMIKYIDIKNQKWYIGKPIMITKNNKYLNLFNGNIGITNTNKEGMLQISFLKENDKIQNIPINILKNYETAWATTVHKSQGSEFMQTALILPNSHLHLLNKDILYTGVTRSRKILNIFSTKKIFMKIALKKTKKNNSLVERINNLQKNL